MTTTTMSLPDTRNGVTLDRVALGCLYGFAGALQWSIALANILLTAMLLCWVALLVRDRTRPSAPAFFIPLLAYGAMTLVASAFSLDPGVSFVDSKQLVLFLVVPAVYHIARGDRRTTVVDVIVSVGAVSAAYGIVQYAILHYDSLNQRPQGNLGHYMTYSGLLMLVMSAAVARLLFGRQGRTWPMLVMPALVAALALTLGRAAWVGALAAVALLLILKKFRLVLILPVVLGAVLLLAPPTVTTRIKSIFNPQYETNQDRLAMLEIGARIVRDYPLTGVGPNMVERVYEKYRPDYAINRLNPHLHNVPMQIAAERGLPALAVWLAFIATVIMGLVRLYRSADSKLLAATGLAAVTAMLAAGLGEHNFGDSEFLMLFLVLITLPFADRQA